MRGNLIRCCARCVPRNTQVVKATCSFVIFGLLTTMMFGRCVGWS